MSCDPRYAGDPEGEPYGEEEEAKELRDITDAVGESGRESGHQLDREVSSPTYIGQWRYDEKHVQFNASQAAISHQTHQSRRPVAKGCGAAGDGSAGARMRCRSLGVCTLKASTAVNNKFVLAGQDTAKCNVDGLKGGGRTSRSEASAGLELGGDLRGEGGVIHG